jgi:hypothetical protein
VLATDFFHVDCAVTLYRHGNPVRHDRCRDHLRAPLPVARGVPVPSGPRHRGDRAPCPHAARHAAVRTGGCRTWPAAGYQQVSAKIHHRCTCVGVVCQQVGRQADGPSRSMFASTGRLTPRTSGSPTPSVPRTPRPSRNPMTRETMASSRHPEVPGQRHGAGRTFGVTAPTAPGRGFPAAVRGPSPVPTDA